MTTPSFAYREWSLGPLAGGPPVPSSTSVLDCEVAPRPGLLDSRDTTGRPLPPLRAVDVPGTRPVVVHDPQPHPDCREDHEAHK